VGSGHNRTFWPRPHMFWPLLHVGEERGVGHVLGLGLGAGGQVACEVTRDFFSTEGSPQPGSGA